jgi:hypothetical protein
MLSYHIVHESWSRVKVLVALDKSVGCITTILPTGIVAVQLSIV